MKRFIFFLLILSFLASCHSQKENAVTVCCKSRLKKDFEKYSARKLGKEFLRIKKDDPKCCEKFGSDLQKIMQAISNKIDTSIMDSAAVVRILGAPDATMVPPQYGIFNKDHEKIMIYWWRHWHDFLYFITENGKIMRMKWFYAYE